MKLFCTEYGSIRDASDPKRNLFESVTGRNQASLAADIVARFNSHERLLAACKAALKETACAFNPHDESEDLIVSMGRTSIQLLHNHLKAAIAAAESEP